MTTTTGVNIHIQEDLLYYFWAIKQFDLRDLKTTDGSSLTLLDFGYRNENSGPDFHHAKIKIGDRIWAGHVEMHVKSSDWHKHNHDQDQAFQNVILHVVYENDATVTLPNGEPLPCLELKNRISPQILATYVSLQKARSWIPCAANVRPMSDLQWQSWYERILVERLLNKVTQIEERLKATENNWEEVFYQRLASNFGFKVNGDVFENLARSLPLKTIIKHKDKPRDIEALLFGQSGLLSTAGDDEYPSGLKENYAFLAKKYQLKPIKAHLWKFMRLRPANFPTIRIAQFAMLLFKSTHLFSKTLAAQSYREIQHLFSCDVSDYWRSHYSFAKKSKRRSKKLGDQAIQLITINTVVPFLFIYGNKTGEQTHKTKAFRFLEQIKREENNITRGFSKLDFPCKTAFDSQALIQLKRNYCDQKKCLSCAVGMNILKPNLGS